MARKHRYTHRSRGQCFPSRRSPCRRSAGRAGRFLAAQRHLGRSERGESIRSTVASRDVSCVYGPMAEWAGSRRGRRCLRVRWSIRSEGRVEQACHVRARTEVPRAGHRADPSPAVPDGGEGDYPATSAASSAPSSQHASRSALPGGPVTQTGGRTARHCRPVVIDSTARTAPVVSMPPCTYRP